MKSPPSPSQLSWFETIYNITWKLISIIATFFKKGSNGRLCGRVKPMKLVQGNIF